MAAPATSSGFCSPVRPPPPAYAPPLPFTTDFRDKAQALEFFDEGWGQDHLRYDQDFDGYGVDTQGLRGLRIIMDDRNGSSCHQDSKVATGHLLTKSYMPAAGGRIEMHTRIGFGTDPTVGFRSTDSFSCLGLYVHDSVSKFGYRNEISMCISSADTKTVRMGYWVGDDGDKQHAKQHTLPIDLAQSFNLYAIDWSPTQIRITINDDPIWVVDGQSMCAGTRAAEFDASGGVKRLPFEPMSVRIILRPRGREYLPPPTFMDVSHFAYKPAAAVSEGPMTDAAAISVPVQAEAAVDGGVDDLVEEPTGPAPDTHHKGGTGAEPEAGAGTTTTTQPQAGQATAGLVGVEHSSMSSGGVGQGHRRPPLLALALGVTGLLVQHFV